MKFGGRDNKFLNRLLEYNSPVILLFGYNNSPEHNYSSFTILNVNIQTDDAQIKYKNPVDTEVRSPIHLQ
jgi:hypothetical protein